MVRKNVANVKKSIHRSLATAVERGIGTIVVDVATRRRACARSSTAAQPWSS